MSGITYPPTNAARLIPGAGYTPPGAPWLTDSVHGVDIYAKGFVRRPTIFFDPNASGSRALGTFKNPYTTAAQVQARCAGSMAGQVLGMKRGSTLRSALTLTLYGSSADPFAFVPYGDAGAMPIINGGTVQSAGWTVYGSDTRLWVNGGTFSTDVDLFEVIGGVYNRLWAVSSIANLSAYASAPVTGTVGAFTRVSSTLYIYLRDGSNPSLGQIETADATNALRINYTDVASTGNIVLAGIAAKMSRDTAISIGAANAAGTNAPSGIVVVGTQGSQAGAQFGSSLGADGLLLYGISDTVRMTGAYVAGVYNYENLNNAVEIGAVDSSTFERNLGYANGGCSIVEAWALNSSNIIRWNRGYGDPNIRPANRPGTGASGYHDSGIWYAGNTTLAGGTLSPAKSAGNADYGNHIQDYGAFGIDYSADQNTVSFNNTFATKNVSGGIDQRFGGGATATGRNTYNNLHFRNAGETFATFVRIYDSGADASTPIPTMNYNWYANKSTPGSSGGAFRIGSTQYFTTATWRTATSQEANSISSLSTTIVDGWTWGGLLNADNVSWLASNTDYSLSGSGFQAAGTSIASTAMVSDIDGRAILTPTTPNVGSYQG